MNLSLKWGKSKWGFYRIKRNLIRFINYVLRLHSFLLKCSLAKRFCKWPFSLLKWLKAFYRPFKGHTLFKNICSDAWPASATSKNALKWWPCRGAPPPQSPCVLRSALFCYRLLFESVIRLYQKCFFREFLVANYHIHSFNNATCYNRTFPAK